MIPLPWDKSKFFKTMEKFQHIEKNNQLCVNNLNADSLNTYFVNVGKNLSSVLPTHVKPKRNNNCSPFEIARCISSLKNTGPKDFMGKIKSFSSWSTPKIVAFCLF